MYIAVAGGEDVKSKAVNEMMERIKHGVVLRPVKSKDSKVRGHGTSEGSIHRNSRPLFLSISSTFFDYLCSYITLRE